VTRKRQSIHSLKAESTKLGFRQLSFEEPGLEQATNGDTVLIYCNNRTAADIIQRSYYQLLGKEDVNIKSTDTHSFSFYGGGKIEILYATKKQTLEDYDQSKTFYRLDWRK